MNEIRSVRLPEVPFDSVRRIDGLDAIQANYAPYLADESRLPHQGAEALFFPRDEAELAAVLRELNRRATPVTISAARTGLVGGCVPFGGAVVSMERFDAVLDIRFEGEWRLSVEAMVSLRDLGDWIVKKAFPGLERRGTDATRAALATFRDDKSAYFYPPDPTEASASVGGTAATNASGSKSFRYGATRDWVRGLRVMLASGEVLDIPRGTYFFTEERTFAVVDSKGERTVLRAPSYTMPDTKNTAGFWAAPGMDLIDLFIGSEGLFGVITTVDVALTPWYPTMSVVQFVPDDDAALDLVTALKAEMTPKPDFIEFYDGHALDLLRARQRENPRFIDMPPVPEDAGAAVFFDVMFDGAAESPDFSALQSVCARLGLSQENSWAGYERRDLARFRHFRHALPETVNGIIGTRKKTHPSLHKLGTDLAVPDDKFRDLWRAYKATLDTMGLEWVAFGHIGDNHLHVNILPRDPDDLERALGAYKDFARMAVDWKGTVSAEHGIGKMKKKFLPIMYSEAQLAEMKAIKRSLDPKALFNRGDVLDFDVEDAA